MGHCCGAQAELNEEQDVDRATKVNPHLDTSKKKKELINIELLSDDDEHFDPEEKHRNPHMPMDSYKILH